MHKKNSNKGMASLSEILSPIAKKTIGKNGFIEIEIITNWEEIIGKELADYSSPQRIDFQKNNRDNGTLHIQTQSGAFALEIKHKENHIISKINSYFGYNAISKLAISQSISSHEIKKIKNTVEYEEKKLVSVEEENYIKQITEDISNPKLKEVIRRLGVDITNVENKNRKE